MIQFVFQSVRMLFILTVLTGLGYPLLVTAAGQALFPRQAAGSLIEVGDGASSKVVGSTLIAQKFSSPRYFSSRPSAADYQTLPPGASNQGPTSAALAEAVSSRRSAWGDGVPADLLTASGSGLDPHLSPAAVLFQVRGVGAARHLDSSQQSELEAFVRASIEAPQFGFLGQPRVNVLRLNLGLDERFP